MTDLTGFLSSLRRFMAVESLPLQDLHRIRHSSHVSQLPKKIFRLRLKRDFQVVNIEG